MQILLGVTPLVCAGACAAWARVVLHPERHQAILGRMYEIISAFAPMTGTRFARVAGPMTILVGSITLVMAGAPAMSVWGSAPQSGASNALLLYFLAALAGVVASGVLLLVVAATGRPRALVLRPLRDKSATEIDAWLSGPRTHEAP